MKKLIFGGVFLAVVGTGIVGCKKETIISNNNKTSSLIEKDGLRFFSENGMLVFNSVEDYELSISDLTADEESYFVSTINGLNYTSYTEELANQGANAVDLIGDNVLSAILNKDRVVQIANYLYKVNIQNEKVFVLPKTKISELSDLINENKTNKNIRQFSIGDDVIYLAESGDPGEKCGGIDGGTYPCYSSSSNALVIGQYANNDVKLNPGVKFFRAGVYFRLSALFELVNMNTNGVFNIEIEVKGPQGWYKRRPCNSGSIGTTSASTFINSTLRAEQKTFYSGTRNLNGYYFFVRGRAKNPNGTYTAWTPYGGRNINSPY